MRTNALMTEPTDVHGHLVPVGLVETPVRAAAVGRSRGSGSDR